MLLAEASPEPRLCPEREPVPLPVIEEEYSESPPLCRILRPEDAEPLDPPVDRTFPDLSAVLLIDVPCDEPSFLTAVELVPAVPVVLPREPRFRPLSGASVLEPSEWIITRFPL